MKLLSVLTLLISLNASAGLVIDVNGGSNAFAATVTAKKTYFSGACERAEEKAKNQAKAKCTFNGFSQCELRILQVETKGDSCTATAQYIGLID